MIRLDFENFGIKVGFCYDAVTNECNEIYIDSDGYEYDYTVFHLLNCCQQYSTL